jgi:hypothetical protein
MERYRAHLGVITRRGFFLPCWPGPSTASTSPPSPTALPCRRDWTTAARRAGTRRQTACNARPETCRLLFHAKNNNARPLAAFRHGSRASHDAGTNEVGVCWQPTLQDPDGNVSCGTRRFSGSTRKSANAWPPRCRNTKRLCWKWRKLGWPVRTRRMPRRMVHMKRSGRAQGNANDVTTTFRGERELRGNEEFCSRSLPALAGPFALKVKACRMRITGSSAGEAAT